MFVYTFWEPRENLPYYLRLCMETWKKFLPNATVVVLDYKNLGDFIDVRELGLNLFSDRRFSFMHVSDAVRVAVLARRGGIWLDVDTIILSPNAEKYFLSDEKHRAIFFGDPATRRAYTCFINTPPVALCMNFWLDFIREKLWTLTPTTPVAWDFFSNKFINDYAKIYADEIKILDAEPATPERKLISEATTAEAAYKNFYFLQNFRLSDVPADLLLLHNSWTPNFFKQLPPQEFFHIDCTMVNVLAEVLDMPLPTTPRARISVAKK